MNEKEAVTPVLSLCNSPFLYFSSLSSSSYCITGALQGFLQPSYRWQAASSAHLLLRPSLLLLLLLLGGSFFVFGFGKFLGGGFQFCFLGFQLRLQIIEICSQRSNLRFDFLFFAAFSAMTAT